MHFSASVVAALLAVGATAVPHNLQARTSQPRPSKACSVFPAEVTCQQTPADKGQIIKTKDCLALIDALNKEGPKKCTKDLRLFPAEYKTLGTCRVVVDGHGGQHCTDPKVVAEGLKAIVNKCKNRWGFVQSGGEAPIHNNPDATKVILKEPESGKGHIIKPPMPIIEPPTWVIDPIDPSQGTPIIAIDPPVTQETPIIAIDPVEPEPIVEYKKL